MKETKHLLHWQFEWLKRFFRTWYHLFNRKAYHKWKNDFPYSNFNTQYDSEEEEDLSEDFTGQHHD